MTEVPRVLWRPSPQARSATRLGRFLGQIEERTGARFDDHEAAWRWSVEHLEELWGLMADAFEVRFHQPPTAVLGRRQMPGATWFPDATLNYAEHAVGDGRPLMVGADATKVWSLSQSRAPVTLTGAELAARVGACRAGLARLGVGKGDRVAAYLPNIAETLIAFLATASLGAVWSSCAPEFGTRSVLDRFGQIEPKVLLVVDGYRYGDKDVDRRSEVDRIRAGLPSVEHTVLVPYLDRDRPAVPDALTWDQLLAEPAPAEFAPVPFDHPLYILYSSGTTGLPKAIVHGHGGVLLEHLKAVGLYADLGPSDRFFWFSTTGWMMWNFLLSGLLVGAGIVLWDGNPAYPSLDVLWQMAADVGVTYFGSSAPFLLACRKAGLRPGAEHDLSALRSVGSTGAPLPAEGFEWVYDAVGADVLLSSISGGTDVCTAFVGGSPLTPVWSGEISCRYLGAGVEAHDADDHAVVGEQGELVITKPMPSMPVSFWGDEDGSRYRDAYFESGSPVWRHGDWVTITERGSCVITGRSDSTLNRGGVRLGTSDFYAVVEELPEVIDSLVVHVDGGAGESGTGSGELLLFVALAPEVELDDGLKGRIVDGLRTELSPRHVPDRIMAVPAVPRTLSGKKLEVPVKRILTGTPVDQAASTGALADPSSLDPFIALARVRPGD